MSKDFSVCFVDVLDTFVLLFDAVAAEWENIPYFFSIFWFLPLGNSSRKKDFLKKMVLVPPKISRSSQGLNTFDIFGNTVRNSRVSRTFFLFAFPKIFGACKV